MKDPVPRERDAERRPGLAVRGPQGQEMSARHKAMFDRLDLAAAIGAELHLRVAVGHEGEAGVDRYHAYLNAVPDVRLDRRSKLKRFSEHTEVDSHCVTC